MRIRDLAESWGAFERTDGNLLDPSILTDLARAATRFYAGYAVLVEHIDADPIPEITGDTELTLSEWAIIRPLFLLYVERETALQLEASRGMGLDVFGRSVSEIAQEITAMEAELPHRAFVREIESV